MKYTVTINPNQIGQEWLNAHGAVVWDWEASRRNIIETANDIATTSPDEVEVKINTIVDTDQTPLAVEPKEGEGLHIYERLEKYYGSGAWIAKPKPSPFAEIPTEGEDLKAYEWGKQYWSDVRWDWPYHADFYRDNYRKAMERQGRLIDEEKKALAHYHTHMTTALAFERDKAQVHCARLRRDAAQYRGAGQADLADTLVAISKAYEEDQQRLATALGTFEYDTKLDEAQVRIAIEMVDHDREARGWAKEAIRNGALGQGPCKTVRRSKSMERMISDTFAALIDQAIFGKRTW